jgi:hypothetical protein
VRWVNPFQGSFAYRLVQSDAEAAACGRLAPVFSAHLRKAA